MWLYVPSEERTVLPSSNLNAAAPNKEQLATPFLTSSTASQKPNQMQTKPNLYNQQEPEE